jgi:putative transposase
MSVGKRRRSHLRLTGFDYSQAGAYFVTVCAKGRKNLFGHVVKEKIELNIYGGLVQRCWEDLPNKYSFIKLDRFVMMPNHMHGIILIVGAGFPRPVDPFAAEGGGETPPLQKQPSLSQIMGYFKYQSAKKINELRAAPGDKIWQRSFYEHVIRDDESLNRIREYIATNPRRWSLDRENPEAHDKDGFDDWLGTFKILPRK